MVSKLFYVGRLHRRLRSAAASQEVGHEMVEAALHAVEGQVAYVVVVVGVVVMVVVVVVLAEETSVA